MQVTVYLGLTVYTAKEGEGMGNYIVYSACIYQII